MENIGAVLKQKRLLLGKSLEEIAENTRIRRRYLEAMESEQWDIFPGKVYLKGFLRTYSNYLGLDDTEILNSLADVLNEETPVVVKLPEKIEMPGRPRRKATVVLAFLAVFLLFSVQYLYRHHFNLPFTPKKQAENLQTSPASPESPLVVLPGTAENHATEIEPLPQPEDPEPVIIDKMKLVIKSVRGKCWIRIRSGNALVYEGTLAQGKEITFNDLHSFSMTLGNAGGVTVLINDVDIGALGGVGDVISKTFVIENNAVTEVTT